MTYRPFLYLDEVFKIPFTAGLCIKKNAEYVAFCCILSHFEAGFVQILCKFSAQN